MIKVRMLRLAGRLCLTFSKRMAKYLQLMYVEFLSIWRLQWDDGLFLMVCWGMDGISGAWARTQWRMVGGSSIFTNNYLVVTLIKLVL
jgi:hypothetical protein